MEVIGVFHHPKYVEGVVSYLHGKYPQGINSMMVELPVSNVEDDDFFVLVARDFKNRGTRIICGDILRRGRAEGTKRLMGAFGNFAGLLISGAYHNFEERIAKTGSRGLLKVLQEQKPEVSVVGRVHADYIKRNKPEVYYTVFEPENHVYPRNFYDGISLAINGKPCNPDRVIVTERVW